VIVVTAGHIDHGKTALVKALTGIDADRLPEEKARGITVDLGFAYTRLGTRTVGFVDVPGHERLVRTMVAGATGVDFALIVVAADDGVMPQTREHIAILDLLGLRRAVVAITKSDRVDDRRLSEVEAQVRVALSGTGLAHAPGNAPLQAPVKAPMIACSALRGTGIADLARYLEEAAASGSAIISSYPPAGSRRGCGACAPATNRVMSRRPVSAAPSTCPVPACPARVSTGVTGSWRRSFTAPPAIST
jgi:selenocysteine-specific elongation factor